MPLSFRLPVNDIVHRIDEVRISHGIRPRKGVRCQRDVLADKTKAFL